MTPYDVVIVGAGNAALSAAMAARENGARVLVLEKAAEEEKGGNSYFTAGGFRFCHTGIDDVATDVLTDLSPAERERIVLPSHDRKHFYDTLMKVTRHQADEDLAWKLIDGSRPAMVWLRGHGIRFIPMFGRQSFLVDGKHHFYGGVNIEAVGGGAGLVEAELKRIAELGLRDPLCDRCDKADPGPEAPCDRGRGAGAGRLRGDPDEGRCAGLRRVRVEPGMAGALSRPRLGPGAGARHAAQPRRRHPHGARDRRGALWQLVGLPLGRLGHLGPALRGPADPRQLPEALLPVGDHGQCPWPERSSTRARTCATSPMSSSAAPSWASPTARRCRSSTRRSVPLLRDEYRIREVTKVKADTIEELARGLEIDPAALKGTVDRFNAACGDTANVQPLDPRRGAHHGAGRSTRPTGRCRSTSRPSRPMSRRRASPSPSAA